MSLYDITIAGVSASAPADGFIDPKSVYVYANADKTDQPTTYANSLSKAKANQRYKNLIHTIQHFTGSLQINEVTAGGSPNANTAPDKIVLRCEISALNAVWTHDENNSGQRLAGVPAIKRIIARALIKDQRLLIEVLDPTKSTAPGNTTQFARSAARFNVEHIGALYANLTNAESSVSVNPVS